MYVIVGHIYSQPPSQHSTVTVGRVIQQERTIDATQQVQVTGFE